MIPQIICWISLPEIGYIVGIAVILFGCKAVSQNPFISKKQKILWMLTILFLNCCLLYTSPSPRDTR